MRYLRIDGQRIFLLIHPGKLTRITALGVLGIAQSGESVAGGHAGGWVFEFAPVCSSSALYSAEMNCKEEGNRRE